MANPKFDLGPAEPRDASEVADVLQEAARWITTWRSQLWDPALLDQAFVAPFIARGEMLTARSEGKIAGVLIVEPEDPLFWPDRPVGEAAYLHKLAVRRAYAGMGVPAALIDHSEGVARGSPGIAYGSIATPTSHASMKAFGFHRVDEMDVTHPEAGRIRVVRMERALAA